MATSVLAAPSGTTLSLPLTTMDAGAGAPPRLYLAAACLFRNSTFYLREWIEYHLLMGVERFYMCDHLSDDGAAFVLAPYVARGQVVFVRCEREIASQPAIGVSNDFEDNIHLPFLRAAGHAAAREAEWVMLLDSDEFVVPSRAADPDLPTVLRRHEDDDTAVLYVNWQTYGTSGVRNVPPGSLFSEALVMRAPQDEPVNWHPKSIVRAARFGQMHSPHWARPVPGTGVGRFTNGVETMEFHFKPPIVDELRINHYNTGDSDYFERYKRPFYLRYVGEGECASRADRLIHCDTEDRILPARWGGPLRARVLGPRLCIVLHMRGDDDWHLCRPYLYNVVRARMPYDLYVTVDQGVRTVDLAAMQALAYGCTDARDPLDTSRAARMRDATLIEVVAHAGGDAGALLAALAQIDRLGRAYDHILKIHAGRAMESGSAAWRAQVDAVAGSPERVCECLAILGAPESHASPLVATDIGMVSPPRCVERSSARVCASAAARCLGVSPNAAICAVRGGVFWARFEPLVRPVAGRGEIVTDLLHAAALANASLAAVASSANISVGADDRRTLKEDNKGSTVVCATARDFDGLIGAMVVCAGQSIRSMAPLATVLLTDESALNTVQAKGVHAAAIETEFARTLYTHALRWNTEHFFAIEQNFAIRRGPATGSDSIASDFILMRARHCTHAVCIGVAPDGVAAHALAFALAHAVTICPRADATSPARLTCLPAQDESFVALYLPVGVACTAVPSEADIGSILDSDTQLLYVDSRYDDNRFTLAGLIACALRDAPHLRWIIVRDAPGIDGRAVLATACEVVSQLESAWRVEAYDEPTALLCLSKTHTT